MMSYLQYVAPAAITFLIALYAFFKDAKASKASVLNWAFVITVGLLWPITLPFIVWKRLLLIFSQDDVEVMLRSSHLV
ncbi:hypothetical protein IQ260_09915 [Leptolyngbya cf. ectocarpi LEGE 11479]|uniref:Uncharacterized protein n=1 Tax=Leptolyngbya cf. ectocarpi LEGE 11479 TaxID=1828722 RepID=A0A928ZR56_LEPEC|nr:hypothetical protein [Leptolyngbya ectocarpi]MBE9066970.1 hypothetical protein [Leptolyngbya cf. ectocarpi LEGE 11479]